MANLRSCAAVAAALCSMLACDQEPDHCEAVHVQGELVLEVGTRTDLIYETDGALPAEHKKLLVRCPRAAAGALALSHDGFGCSSNPSADSSRSTGWQLQPSMEYVLSVNGSVEGYYELVAEVRDNTEQARFGEPTCTLLTKVQVVRSSDAAVGDM